MSDHASYCCCGDVAPDSLITAMLAVKLSNSNVESLVVSSGMGVTGQRVDPDAVLQWGTSSSSPHGLSPS